MERYKARGFTREYRVVYDETFAPTAHLTAIHSLIFVASSRRWSLFQMDVKNPFLNGDLQEEVYMKQASSYPHSLYQVYHLH